MQTVIKQPTWGVGLSIDRAKLIARRAIEDDERFQPRKPIVLPPVVQPPKPERCKRVRIGEREFDSFREACAFFKMSSQRMRMALNRGVVSLRVEVKAEYVQ